MSETIEPASKSLQATPNGVSSSAIADYVIGPAWLTSGRWAVPDRKRTL